MKKMFKYIIPCLALATVFVSCKDDDNSKAYIDSLYENGTTTQVTATEAPAVASYNSANFTASLNSLDDVVECGFQVATQEDFSDAVSYPAEIDSTAMTYSAAATDLEGSTDYYYRSYIVTKAGGTIYGESKTFTTPRVPLFEIDGTFLVHELEYDEDNGWIPQLNDDGEDVGYYLLSIEFADENKEDVIIHGFLGFEDAEVVGTWDEESQTVTIEAPQVVGEHPRYGEMFFMGLDQVPPTAYTDNVVLSFTPMGGLLSSTCYSLNVSAGYFGFYRFDAVPYEEGEE